MAHVRITRVWPGGERITVNVEVDSSYPDALAEARAEAHREFTEAVQVVETDE